MQKYALTVFDKKGKQLLNEIFAAADNEEAKKVGYRKLEENDYLDCTHRCVSPDGKLLLFHR